MSIVLKLEFLSLNEPIGSFLSLKMMARIITMGDWPSRFIRPSEKKFRAWNWSLQHSEIIKWNLSQSTRDKKIKNLSRTLMRLKAM